ncbi:hypothetical protein CCYS_14095 [Corynebacterium cystitidis DSM 20524]|nr:hypothetical protein CCYS_14095 [Corynebacterium cystitidis DSM 20524]SNV91249.1 Uncharacterised protein [Corynebacterium cystitidis]
MMVAAKLHRQALIPPFNKVLVDAYGKKKVSREVSVNVTRLPQFGLVRRFVVFEGCEMLLDFGCELGW